MEKMERRGDFLEIGFFFYKLANADHVVLMAEDGKGMKLLLNKFQEYVTGKNLNVNVGECGENEGSQIQKEEREGIVSSTMEGRTYM